MAKRKTSAALAWMLTATMAVNSGSIVWAAEDGKISVERIEAGETSAFSDSDEETNNITEENEDISTENADVQEESGDMAAFSAGEADNEFSTGEGEDSEDVKDIPEDGTLVEIGKYKIAGNKEYTFKASEDGTYCFSVENTRIEYLRSDNNEHYRADDTFGHNTMILNKDEICTLKASGRDSQEYTLSIEKIPDITEITINGDVEENLNNSIFNLRDIGGNLIVSGVPVNITFSDGKTIQNRCDTYLEKYGLVTARFLTKDGEEVPGGWPSEEGEYRIYFYDTVNPQIRTRGYTCYIKDLSQYFKDNTVAEVGDNGDIEVTLNTSLRKYETEFDDSYYYGYYYGFFFTAPKTEKYCISGCEYSKIEVSSQYESGGHIGYQWESSAAKNRPFELEEGKKYYICVLAKEELPEKITMSIALPAKTILEKLCAECDALNESEYTERSWSNLQQALNQAKQDLENENISDQQIYWTIDYVNEVKNALIKKVPTVTPTPTPSEPTATPTPTPSEPTATPTPIPSEPTATPTPTPSEPTTTPTPTPSQPSTPSEPSTPSQPTPAPVPDGYPEGTTSDANGNLTTPNGTVIKTDGTITLPDGSEIKADDQGKKPSIDKEGTVTDTNGTTVDVNGNITLPGAELNDVSDNIIISTGKDGARPQYVQSEAAVITAEGSVISRPGLDDLTAGKGWKVTNDGVATDTEGNVYGADGSVKNSEGTYTKPAKAVTAETNETGNKAKVKVDECNGAQGYDFVIGKSADLLKTKKYTKVVKNQVSPEATFAYTDKGTWYVACHAWTRGTDGKKVFGQWSEVQEMEITATTPQAPKIKKVTVKGSTVTVTYTPSENADGYDIILGTKYSRVNGEKRPTDYGKNVKKIKGNTYQAVFKNVKEGTYYVAAHAWNRTSEDAKKVFSEWSNTRSTDVQ